MKTREHLIWAGAVVGSVALIGAITNAGDLNPPTSGIQSSMHTLDEIYDAAAVAAFGAAGGVPTTFGGPAYMELEINGSPLAGEDTVDGVPDVIQIFGFDHTVVIPTDIGSGQATGSRAYEPVIIRKRIDKTSPPIAQALTNGTRVDATLRFLRPIPGARMSTHENYLTIQLTDCRLTALSLSSLGGSSATEPPTEEVAIVFKSITWTYEPTGAQHNDSWVEAP